MLCYCDLLATGDYTTDQRLGINCWLLLGNIVAILITTLQWKWHNQARFNNQTGLPKTTVGYNVPLLDSSCTWHNLLRYNSRYSVGVLICTTCLHNSRVHPLLCRNKSVSLLCGVATASTISTSLMMGDQPLCSYCNTTHNLATQKVWASMQTAKITHTDLGRARVSLYIYRQTYSGYTILLHPSILRRR